jgi:hypothetical protein
LTRFEAARAALAEARAVEPVGEHSEKPEEVARRTDILEGGALARVHVFRDRLPMMHRLNWPGPISTSQVDYGWFVWDRNHREPATFHRISCAAADDQPAPAESASCRTTRRQPREAADMAYNERTEFRLAMLEHGYWPTLNRGKAPVLGGWQKAPPDEAEVRSWDRSLHPSTGMVIDGDLMAIDADIDDAGLVEALADALGVKYPALFRAGLVRHAAQAKEAWFARVEKPFRYFASRRWARPAASGLAASTCFVECFGSRTTRQFAVSGPHSYAKDGSVARHYAFAGGASPATTPRESLPVLPVEAATMACDLFERLAEARGLRVVPLSKPHGAGDQNGGAKVYDLTSSMTFEAADVAYRLDELEDAYAVARHDGRDLRISSSFLGAGSNVSKCIVGFSKARNCICIHDFETGITHLPVSARGLDPRICKEFSERLRTLDPFRRREVP